MSLYSFTITEGEKELIRDALKASGAEVPCAEIFVRAVLAAGMRELIAAKPSDARKKVADAIAFLRQVED